MQASGTQRLYRPVGIKELELIAAAGWKAFPPRLEWQPIFYPVLNEAYAAQIAQQWNTQDEFSGYCGLVTAFDVDAAYLQQYAVQNVGGNLHDELWIPAETLPEFNAHIHGEIVITKAFFGDGFVLPADSSVSKVLLKLKQQ
ncbi:MAG: ADP-ribosylation/crystallin J1 [Bacteroidota bacterium]